MRGGWRRCLHVFLLVGVGLGGCGSALYGGCGVTRCSVDTGVAAGSVGVGVIGTCTLSYSTVISGGVRIGSVGTL